MKEYDIFLKQRLTEGSIIVYSLPFRDGVSAVNRVVLRAMLSYFSLQKKIAVANQSALLSEIDEMLATVSEKIGDQVCLEASAALTIKYRNELEQAAMRLDRKGVRKMSQAHLGCFCGTVTPNVNMLDIFKQNERADNPNSILNFGQMSLRKLSMICPEGTKVKINGKEIPLITGIFELGMDQINITSLEFSEAVNVNIYYMF